MAEATALQAKMKLDTSEVKRTGTLEKGYKNNWNQWIWYTEIK